MQSEPIDEPLRLSAQTIKFTGKSAIVLARCDGDGDGDGATPINSRKKRKQERSKQE